MLILGPRLKHLIHHFRAPWDDYIALLTTRLLLTGTKVTRWIVLPIASLLHRNGFEIPSSGPSPSHPVIAFEHFGRPRGALALTCRLIFDKNTCNVTAMLQIDNEPTADMHSDTTHEQAIILHTTGCGWGPSLSLYSVLRAGASGAECPFVFHT